MDEFIFIKSLSNSTWLPRKPIKKELDITHTSEKANVQHFNSAKYTWRPPAYNSHSHAIPHYI